MESKKSELIGLIKQDEVLWDIINSTVMGFELGQESYLSFLAEKGKLKELINERASKNRAELFELVKKEFNYKK